MFSKNGQLRVYICIARLWFQRYIRSVINLLPAGPLLVSAHDLCEQFGAISDLSICQSLI